MQRQANHKLTSKNFEKLSIKSVSMFYSQQNFTSQENEK